MRITDPRVSDESEKLNRAGDAIEEAIAWHTVGIVPKNRPEIGTGTAIAWSGRNLIVTAKNVVSSVSASDLWFLFRPPDRLTRGDPRRTQLTERDFLPRQSLPVRDIWRADDEDFAVI